jgi:hypothetical protein
MDANERLRSKLGIDVAVGEDVMPILLLDLPAPSQNSSEQRAA